MHLDCLASVTVLSDYVDGSVGIVTSYSPYGQVLNQKGDSGTRYDSTGEQCDRATWLLYLRTRYYSPYLNRFFYGRGNSK